MKVNGNDPAHPVLILGEDMCLEAQHKGMPIRLAIAKDLLAAYIAKYGFTTTNDQVRVSSLALNQADALLKAYNESEG